MTATSVIPVKADSMTAVHLNDIELLTPAETAKLLRVTPGTLEVWRCEKVHKLDYIKVGGRVMYERVAVREFIESRRVVPGARKARPLTRSTRSHRRKTAARARA